MDMKLNFVDHDHEILDKHPHYHAKSFQTNPHISISYAVLKPFSKLITLLIDQVNLLKGKVINHNQTVLGLI